MVTATLQRIKYVTFSPSKQQAFIEDFATLINDGIPVKQAAEVIAQSGEGPAIEIANNILIRLAEGKYIADGLRDWFPNHIVEIIRAGEEGGTLYKTLSAASDALKQKTSIISALFNSLAYPLVVLGMGFAVAIFINHSIFENYRTILPYDHWPIIGQRVADFADFIQHWWWFVILMLFLLLMLTARVLHNYVGEGRRYVDVVPILAIYRQLIAARFMQTLGLLIANGVVLKKALRILQNSANPYLSSHLLTMEYRLGGGKDNIAEILDTGLIDPNHLTRLRIIARGTGFELALLRQSQHAIAQNVKMIKVAGKIMGNVILGLDALLAIFLIYGIYMVGSSVGSYQ